MGCTSSAQSNSVPPTPHANSTEKSQISQTMNEEDTETCSDESKKTVDISNTVLPTRDNTSNIETIDALDSNEDIIESSCEDVTQTVMEERLNELNNSENSTSDYDEKLEKLQDVVERVVEIFQNPDSKLNAEVIEDNTTTVSKEEEEVNIDTETSVVETPTEETEDPVSPSQSSSSRATRWEALADIAAELPPSLTVDPLTGQIYALSK